MRAGADFVPTFFEFRPAVLRVLSDGESHVFKDLVTEVADYMRLSPEARAQRINSGQERYRNRIGWACSGLYQAGLIDRPARGVYRITKLGREIDAKNLSYYDDEQMKADSQQYREYWDEISARKGTNEAAASGENFEKASAGHDAALPTPSDTSGEDPLEVLEARIDELNAQVETQLRKKLQAESPEFFEKAVIDLLWAMGYGGAHGEKRHVGRSNDGGIDGVISQDALGLQNVYIQAKRYADGNTVGRPVIQQFYGALAQRGADRGVFITTSSFSKGALEAAHYLDKRIVLIDGIRLTALMLSYGVGVQKTREFSVFEVDEDYFDGDLV